MRRKKLRKELDKMVENDEISDAEAGFMLGYQES